MQFTRDVRDLRIEEGDCAIFEARFEPKTAEARWFREDTEILDCVDFRILTKNGVSTLVIGEVYAEDAGTFTCCITGNGQQNISSGQLAVTGSGGVCTGQPAPKEVFKPVAKSVITIGGQQMVIDKEQADQIRKQHPKGFFQSAPPSAPPPKPTPVAAPKPMVHKPPVPVQYVPKASSSYQTVPATSNSTTEAKVKSVQPPVAPPKPKFTGTTGGTVKPYMPAPSSAPKAVLVNTSHIPQTTKQITTVVAQPASNRSSVHEPIDLTRGDEIRVEELQSQLSTNPPVFEDASDAEFDKIEGDEDLLEPQIQESLIHCKVNRGDSLTLQATSIGRPLPKCFWFKEGRQISKTSKHFIIRSHRNDHDSVTFSLLVHQTCAQDDGIYSCVVISPAGLAISTARIRIADSGNTANIMQSSITSSQFCASAPQQTKTTVVAEPEPVETANDSHAVQNAYNSPDLPVPNDSAQREEECQARLESCTLATDQQADNAGEEEGEEEAEFDRKCFSSGQPSELDRDRFLSGQAADSLQAASLNDAGSTEYQPTGPAFAGGPNKSIALLTGQDTGRAAPNLPKSLNKSTARIQQYDDYKSNSRPLSRLSSRPASPFRQPGSRPASRGGFLPRDVLRQEEEKVNSSMYIPRGIVEPDEEIPQKYYKPHFLQAPPQDIVVQEGKFIRLDTKVTGLPIPQINFIRNGYPVTPDWGHKLVVRENNVHSLLIERAHPDIDQGTYIIQAKNIAGLAQVEVNVVVHAKQEEQRPIFRAKPQGPIKIGLGESFEMEIQVTGFPKPQIGWKRGSDGVIPNGHRVILDVDDNTNTQKLTVHNATRADAGWYTCCAVNRQGIASCTCKVEILEEWEMEGGGGSMARDHGTRLTGHVDADDDHGLVVQKSSRLAKMNSAMREQLRYAYSRDAQGPRPDCMDQDDDRF